MKYYKDTATGEVYAYEADGSQDEYIKPDLVPMTTEEVEAHLNPPREPVYKTQFSPLEYLDRFTESEQLAVVAATMTVPAVKLWYDRMLAASYVDLGDPRTEAGIDALIAAELIAPERKAALMEPELIG